MKKNRVYYLQALAFARHVKGHTVRAQKKERLRLPRPGVLLLLGLCFLRHSLWVNVKYKGRNLKL